MKKQKKLDLCIQSMKLQLWSSVTAIFSIFPFHVPEFSAPAELNAVA